MKKYKLLYFVSEDKYFLSHKIKHAIYAKKNGFDVLVVCNLTKYEQKIKQKGINILGINSLRKSINPLSQLYLIIKFLNIIKQFNPDIIQNIALKPILIGSVSAILFKKKVCVVNAFVGLGYLFINNNILTTILRSVITNILKIILKKKNFYSVFQNNDDQAFFKKKKILDMERTFVIKGSGVETNYFKPKNVKKKYDVILHSRMLRDKGIYEYIESIKIIIKKKNIKALLLGSPDNKNYASIGEVKLEKWNSEKIVEWVPFTENVRDYLNQSKISILPSYREGLPKSLLEAASCGLPIITTKVPGCKEICVDNYNGLLVETKNAESISKAIMYLLDNKDKREIFSKNSRKLVLKNFCVRKISKEFANLYLKILKLK